jgi:hypothetical protein
VSVLLRQPHGFEDLFRFSEGTEAEHLSITEPPTTDSLSTPLPLPR